MTKEELKARHPAVYAAWLEEGRAAGKARFDARMASFLSHGFSQLEAAELAAADTPQEERAALRSTMEHQFQQAGYAVRW